MLYAVCRMLDAAAGHVPVSRLPLKVGVLPQACAAPVPGQVSTFTPRVDVAAVPVKIPNAAADAPAMLPVSIDPAAVPVTFLSPAADAPVLPLPIAPAAVPVKMSSYAADAPAAVPVKMSSHAADAPAVLPLIAVPRNPVLPLIAVLPLSCVAPAATCPVPNLRDPAADMTTMRARPVSSSPHSNCQSPLTDRRHSCANCASLGQWCTCCKGNHMTKRPQSLRSASTPVLGSANLKSSGGSREPTEAQKITPVPFSPR